MISTEVQHKKCLLLNADYSPFGLIDWIKAISWSFRSIESDTEFPIEIIDFYKNDFIQGIGKNFQFPPLLKQEDFFILIIIMLILVVKIS